jgi:hypothetical protein
MNADNNNNNNNIIIIIIISSSSSSSSIEQIEVRKCLLSFGAESFVFQDAIQKFKDQDI